MIDDHWRAVLVVGETQHVLGHVLARATQAVSEENASRLPNQNTSPLKQSGRQTMHLLRKSRWTSTQCRLQLFRAHNQVGHITPSSCCSYRRNWTRRSSPTSYQSWRRRWRRWSHRCMSRQTSRRGSIQQPGCEWCTRRRASRRG